MQKYQFLARRERQALFKRPITALNALMAHLDHLVADEDDINEYCVERTGNAAGDGEAFIVTIVNRDGGRRWLAKAL